MANIPSRAPNIMAGISQSTLIMGITSLLI
jgi:hypothetical protein